VIRGTDRMSADPSTSGAPYVVSIGWSPFNGHGVPLLDSRVCDAVKTADNSRYPTLQVRSFQAAWLPTQVVSFALFLQRMNSSYIERQCVSRGCHAICYSVRQRAPITKAGDQVRRTRDRSVRVPRTLVRVHQEESCE
jgi:hypothetical protein